MTYIAIVWDERNILTSLRLCFEAEGFEVDTFEHPLVALPKLIFVPPHLLILNGHMPGMHGLEFFARFREYSRAPVVFASASADMIEAELARRGTPAEAYLEIPFSQRHIVQLAKDLIHAGHLKHAAQNLR